MSTSGNDKSSASNTLGRQGRAALRIAGRKTGENRWARAFYRAGSATLDSTGHVVHSLWLEVTGFLFVVLALVGGGATVREYNRYAAGNASVGKVVIAGTFTLLFLYFGISSFWRSRRTSKRS